MTRILMIAPLPPPVHGAAAVSRQIKESAVINQAFDKLRFLGSEPVDTTLYGLKRQTRDDEARHSYKQITSEGMRSDDQFLLDILRIKTKQYD